MTEVVVMSRAKQLEKSVQQIVEEIKERTGATREAATRSQELQHAAQEIAGRIDGLQAELRTLTESQARQLLGGGPLNMESIERLEETRRRLLLELPVRVRAADLARGHYQQAERELNAARAQHMSVLQAQSKLVIR